MSDEGEGWAAFVAEAECAEICDLEALRDHSSDDDSSSPSVPRSQQTSDPPYVRLLKEHTWDIKAGGIQSNRAIQVVSACTAACAEAAVLEDSDFVKTAGASRD